MRAKFCESTLDIALLISREEAEKLKRVEGCIPVLTAENKGLTFHLTNSDFQGQPKPIGRIKVMEPRNPSFPHYYVKLPDDAYTELIRNGECGTRYAGSSKVKVIIEDEF